MNDRQRIPVPAVLNPVHDSVEAEAETRAEQAPAGDAHPLSGLWVRDGGGDAAVDDTPRDHLGRPAQDWQRRPVPWEYTSKAKYRRDLQKFMEEVFEEKNDGND